MKKSILLVLGILFSFTYLQAQCDAVGGTISTTDPTTICADGNSPDPINVDLTGNMGTNSSWVITDPNGNILGLPPGPPFDLDGAGAGTCLIWHLSHENDLTGAVIGNNAADLGGCFELSNAITVNRSNGETDGGNIATTDPTVICVGDGIDDIIDATLTGNVGTNSIWVITDDALDILALPTAPPFNFEGAGTGICLIWHLSYEDGLEGAVVGGSALDLQGCFSLSPDPIAVTRFGVNGGELSTSDGATELAICAGDGISDAFDVNLTGTEGMNSGWVITDPNGNILGLPMAPPFDLEGAGEGVCYVWHISFQDGLEGAVVGNNAADLNGCFDLSNPIIVTRNGVNGGELATTDGATELMICAGDGNSDAFDVTLSDAEGANSAWVITDPAGNILGLPTAPPFDLEGAGTGVCYLWHLSFEDGLEGAAVGNNAADLQGCFSLSNPIIVTRTGVNGGDLTTTDGATELTICAGDGNSDAFDVTLTGTEGANSAWVITDPDGNILGLPTAPPFDLEGAGAGNCYIWHLSFEAGLEGAEVGNNAGDLVGCFSLSNPIIVNRSSGDTDGGTITTNDPTEICAGDGIGDPIDVILTGNLGTNSAWVITDPDGNILGLPASPPFDLEGAGTGVCYIWHLSFEDGLMGAAVGNNAADLQGCYDLSDPIIVTRTGVNGGDLTTSDGATELAICAGDGSSDAFDITLNDAEGTNSAWVITDTDGNILGLPTAPPFDLEGAGVGTCLIWHLSFEDGLEGAAVGNNAADLQGCFSLSNPITVNRYSGDTDGGIIVTNDPTEICAGDGIADPIDVALTGNVGTNSAWVITDPDGNILGLPTAPPFDLEGAGQGTCYIWHLSFEDGLTGAAVGNNAADLQGCYDLSEPIIVTRNGVDGGELATSDGTTELTICAGDGTPDPFDVTLAGNNGTNSAWVITDADGNILGLPAGPPFDLEGAGAGVCYLWHLSFEDGLEGAAVGNNAADLSGCYDLSNPIIVTRNGVNGGELATTDGTTELTICAGDGIPDPFDVTLTGNNGTNSAWVITDTDGNILGLPTAPPFDLEGAGAGTCLIWHLSFEDGLEGAAVGNNAADLSGCFSLSNPIVVTRLTGADCGNTCDVEGGDLTTTDGATELTICAGDGNSDAFDVSLSANSGMNSAWVITDPNGNILGLPMAPPFDLEGAGTGVCYVWHISFEDGLEGVVVGNNAADLQGCFSLSNPIIVTRNGVDGGELATTDGETELTICAGDDISDAFDVNLTDTEGTNSAWVITDADGNILGLPMAPPFDLEGAGAGVCYLWHLSFEDGLEGAAVGNNAADLSGCYDLSNPIIVTRLTGADCDVPCDVEGGTLSTNDPTEICIGDGNPDPINVDLSGNTGSNSKWLITNEDGLILAMPLGSPFDLEGAGFGGTCLIWHLSYEDGLVGAENGNNAATDLVGCYSLSNPIAVLRTYVNGGTLATTDGATELNICAGDGNSDAFDVNLTDNEGANSAWVITDADGNILGLPTAPPFDLEGAGSGVCYLWHLSFEDGLEGAAVGNNAADLEGCFSLSNPIIVTRNGVNGGELATTDGATELTICAGDGISDEFDITLTDNEGSNSAWVITDPNGNILGLPTAPPFDLEGAGAGTCYVWHLSFEDGLTGAAVGNNAADLTGCFSLSNPIIVTRLTGADCSQGVDVELDISVDNLLYDQYEHVIYTVTVSNAGTETATGVTVAAGLPSGMVYSDHDTDKGSYSLYFETWTVGSLEAGETATLELDLFTLIEEVDITNFVQVMTTDQADVDSTPGNDTDDTPDEDDEAAVTISPASNGGTGTGEGDADLSLNLSVENNEYEQYEHSFWTYTVTNDGPDEATGIVVSITEPSGFKYTGDDASTGDYSDWFEEWEIPSLAVGETATLIIDFYAVTDEEVTYFTEIAIANENDPDSTPGNDTDEIADEDDEASITLTELNGFVGGGGASTNGASNNSVTASELAFSNLYPNPATEQISLVIGSATDLETTLHIFNLQGSILMEQSVSLTKGMNQVELDITALPTAAYVIKVTDQEGKQAYKKFTKMNN